MDTLQLLIAKMVSHQHNKVQCDCRLLSRSDIFKPLFQEDYEDFLEKEREAMATGQGVQATW
jgi:hypothetical protein